MTNVVEDLNVITTIPKASIAKLFQRVEWLICNAVYEAYSSKENSPAFSGRKKHLWILTSALGLISSIRSFITSTL